MTCAGVWAYSLRVLICAAGSPSTSDVGCWQLRRTARPLSGCHVSRDAALLLQSIGQMQSELCVNAQTSLRELCPPAAVHFFNASRPVSRSQARASWLEAPARDAHRGHRVLQSTRVFDPGGAAGARSLTHHKALGPASLNPGATSVSDPSGNSL